MGDKVDGLKLLETAEQLGLGMDDGVREMIRCGYSSYDFMRENLSYLLEALLTNAPFAIQRATTDKDLLRIQKTGRLINNFNSYFYTGSFYRLIPYDLHGSLAMSITFDNGDQSWLLEMTRDKDALIIQNNDTSCSSVYDLNGDIKTFNISIGRELSNTRREGLGGAIVYDFKSKKYFVVYQGTDLFMKRIELELDITMGDFPGATNSNYQIKVSKPDFVDERVIFSLTYGDVLKRIRINKVLLHSPVQPSLFLNPQITPSMETANIFDSVYETINDLN